MPPRDSVARLELAGSIHAASAFINSYKHLLLNRPPNLPKRPNGCLQGQALGSMVDFQDWPL
jgi:hypothetical protein